MVYESTEKLISTTTSLSRETKRKHIPYIPIKEEEKEPRKQQPMPSGSPCFAQTK
jgi:hypothetical protein